MGLDWIPPDIAKAGHEAELERLRRRISWGLPIFTARWKKRYDEIVTAPYESLGAPRVGFDAEADDWARSRYAEQKRKEGTEEEFLRKLHGYHVLQLLKGPGVPEFTHGGLYEGVDATSFRGQWVIDSRELITDEIRKRAYARFSSLEAMEYGRELLERATAVAAIHGLDAATATAPPEDCPSDSIAGQIEIFRSAAEWFQFWGQRGRGVRPWA